MSAAISTQTPHGIDYADLGSTALQAECYRLRRIQADLLALAKQYASECAECNGTGIQRGLNPCGDFDSHFDRPCEQCDDIHAAIVKATQS